MLIKCNGVELYYQKIGQGQPILLLHGNGESHEIFSKLIPKLTKEYTVYAIDSRNHGQSSQSNQLGYQHMMEDIISFITVLEIKKPILYGFSDGGIIGLLLAHTYPTLLSKLIISGANTYPKGLKNRFYYTMKVGYIFTKNPKLRLMVKEPHITKQQLQTIQIPVLVLAGENDIVKESNTRFIAKHIPQARLQILKRETHSSYVVNSDSLYPIIKQYVNNKKNNAL